MGIHVEINAEFECDNEGCTHSDSAWGSSRFGPLEAAITDAEGGVALPDGWKWDEDGDTLLCADCAENVELDDAEAPDIIALPSMNGRYPCPICGHLWRTTSSALGCCSLLAEAAS